MANKDLTASASSRKQEKKCNKNSSDLEKNMLFGFFFLIVANVRSRSVYVVFFEKIGVHILKLKLKLL